MGNLLVVYGVHIEETSFALKVKNAYLQRYGIHRNIHFCKVNGVAQDSNSEYFVYDEISAIVDKLKPDVIVDLHHSKGFDKMKISLDKSIEVDFMGSDLFRCSKYSELLASLSFIGDNVYYKDPHDRFSDVLKTSPKTIYLQLEALLHGSQNTFHNNAWNNGVKSRLVELLEQIRTA